jgi:hypothetical protein
VYKKNERACLVDNDTSATHVVTASAYSQVADLELDEGFNLGRQLERGRGHARSGGGLRNRGEDELDGVVDLDGRVGVADRAAVVGDEVRDTLGTKLDALDLGQLVCGCSD